MYLYLILFLFCASSLAPIAARAQAITKSPIAQNSSDQPLSDPSEPVPDAPAPQDQVLALVSTPAQQPSSGSTPQANSGQQGAKESSSAQPSDPPTPPSDPPVVNAEQNKQQKAQQQLKEEEQQRVLGVVPNFNTSYRRDAVSLTSRQKMQLAFRSAVDPFTFAAAFLAAGYHEALDDDSGFGWGFEGYMKRSGAAYLDAFNGTIIGNGILPSLLHQDPRYFRLGHGSKTHRVLYAISTTFICPHDNTGKWEPNYSNVGGNLIAGAISNLYYPGSTSWSQTIESGITVTAEGTIGGVFNEFWPDISRKLFHKDPTHGLDEQVGAASPDSDGKQEKQTQSAQK